MPSGSISLVNARELNHAEVRRFYAALNSDVTLARVLPDDNDAYDRGGVGISVNGELLGLYTYSVFQGFQSGHSLCYPYGGMLKGESLSLLHHRLVEGLLAQIRLDSNVQILICLANQSLALHDVTEEEKFWLAHRFSHFDTQIHYQGPVPTGFGDEQSLAFSVSTYASGNPALDLELIDLYRHAYISRPGVPDISLETIRQQLDLSEYACMIIRHDDELVGQASLIVSDQNCYVESIYIKRRYWGVGCSDTFARALSLYAASQGCTTVSGIASSINRATCALMERFGLTPQYQFRRMGLKI